ncbi:MAG: T9SS type A sorting domain-containing protein [Candidatus Latescibacteria bacterium]|nr:T9SS type A sorting domain-containing protein [Candidatus Latescibacterota bacterium]
MSKNILLTILVFVAVVFAANSEVITYTENWGRNSMFNVASETDAGIEVVFSIHQMVIEEMDIDGQPMKSYGIPGIFLPNDQGAPNLAGTGRYIAIPQGATARATIVNARTEVYKNIEVAPAPNIPLDTDDAPLRYVKNMDIYDKDAYYPDAPVKLSEPLQIRGVDCVILGITPFQYNPVTKELIVYKDIRVRVDFIGGNGHFGDDVLRNIYWEPILQGHLLNYSSLPKVDFFAPERIGGRNGYEYIIIVPDDPVFIAWGDTIKRWRNLQGISTQVYTLTQVGGNTTTAIKNFLTTAYNTWTPRPVGFLLLSDYESSGKVYGITSYRQSHPYSGTYVSDLWNADMTNNHLPDMFHARICAQNETQLSVMVNKFLNHERTPPTAANFYNEPLVACGWQTERWFQLCAEVVRGFFVTGLGKNPARQYNIYSGTPTAGGNWSTATNTATVVNYFYNVGWLPSLTNPNGSAWWNNGSTQGIVNAINSGGFMLQHRDHGSETGWGEPQFNNSSINSLTNDKLIFVNSHNCLTGRFDWSNECFTEKFHRYTYNNAPSGALGVNAASHVSYSFVNDAYAWGMYDCMWQQFMPDYPTQDIMPSSLLYPCAAQNYGKIFLYGSSWPYNTGNKQVTYYLFHHHGDVFNPLYSEVPQNLTVTHMPTLMGGVASFTVTANDSAIVALTVNGEIIGAAQATGSPQAITIAPQIPGNNMIVTVTKQNYYRYQTTIPVVSSSYPYIITTTGIVNDSGGNNQLNPGEIIDWGVWAKNIGVGTGHSIYGLLTTTDSFVSMVIDSSWFGNILQDDSALSNPYYRFQIANNCPNNHLLNFMFQFHDMYDSTFLSYGSLRVFAPILTYLGTQVVGGDNNQVINLGETVNLVVTLRNIGGANAENINAVLTCNTTGIIINDPNSSFGTIDTNNIGTNALDPFMVTADSSITPGTMAEFQVIVTAGVYVETLQFSLPVEVYFANFELPNNYVADPLTNAWQWGEPVSGPNAAYSGTQVWATVLGGNYANSANWKLTSEPFVATIDNPQLKFWHWYQMELSGMYPGRAYDGGNVKISTNGGLNWNLIRPVSGYDGFGYTTNAGIANESCYSGNSQSWVEATFILPVTAGQQFLIRWHFGSDAAVVMNGWYLDDVMGIGFMSAMSGIEQGLEPIGQIRTMLLAAKPNPVSQGMTNISFSIASPAKVGLKIYDASGRLIKTLINSSLEKGVYNYLWNGRDEQNRAVAEGIYFYTLQTDDYRATKKLILTR